jgi:hypothetical protein
MRQLLLVPLVLVLSAPAAAQLPISGVGDAGGAQYRSLRRWLGGGDTQPDRIHSQYRQGEIAGRIGQLRRRIREMRDNGEISGAEARRMRRETRHMSALYYASSANDFSSAEADLLQSRLNAFASLTSRPRVPAGR